jgi:hypothetical protein
MSGPDAEVFKGSNFEYWSNLEFTKPMLFNQFYKENFEYERDDYIRYKTKNSLTNFQYKSNKEDKLKKYNYKTYYNNLSESEKKSISDFLDIVAERVNSGTGESVSRGDVRDYFFKTPKSFQMMFSEKPSVYLWRGDYAHPCSDDYNNEDKDYLAMQSFTINKNVAHDFGFAFNAKNIKSYSGSFSLPLYTKYGGEQDFGDDEGEVMFFDVEYNCNK